MERRWLWRAVRSISPDLAWLTAALYGVYRKANMIFWTYDLDDDDPGSLMPMVSENIDRAPTPLGLDRFVISVEQLASIEGDPAGMTYERADATLESRRVVRSWKLRGDRWRDWKRGSTKEELMTILQLAVPTPEAPITLIRAAVLGAAFARIHARFGEV